MIYIIIITSFLLEGITTNLISMNSLLIPVFTITSFVITYPYFNKEKKYLFLLTSLSVGICYDIVYTNSLFINTFSFIICSLIIILIHNFLSHRVYNVMLINIFILILFRICTYFLLTTFSNNMSFNKELLFKGIYSSLILNIIYGLILYFVCDKLAKKLNIIKK